MATGDYEVLLGRDVVFTNPAKWGLAQTRLDCRARIDEGQQEQREADRRAELHRARALEQEERERLYLRQLPNTACRKCGAPTAEAFTEQGQRLPLDTTPTPDGDWLVVAQRVPSRSPVIRRATDERTADRYELHHVSCSRRAPSFDRRGQSFLRFGKSARLAELPPRRRARPQARQRLLTTTAHAEQLELPC
ncbi:MAG: hypothetical protein ACRBN8_22600 [Nannocystales bacterium]